MHVNNTICFAVYMNQIEQDDTLISREFYDGERGKNLRVRSCLNLSNKLLLQPQSIVQLYFSRQKLKSPEIAMSRFDFFGRYVDMSVPVRAMKHSPSVSVPLGRANNNPSIPLPDSHDPITVVQPDPRMMTWFYHVG